MLPPSRAKPQGPAYLLLCSVCCHWHSRPAHYSLHSFHFIWCLSNMSSFGDRPLFCFVFLRSLFVIHMCMICLHVHVYILWHMWRGQRTMWWGQRTCLLLCLGHCLILVFINVCSRLGHTTSIQSLVSVSPHWLWECWSCIDALHHTQIYIVLKIQTLRSPYLHSKHFTHRAIFPPSGWILLSGFDNSHRMIRDELHNRSW